MKTFAIFVCLASLTSFAFAVELSDTQKRHRNLRHEENRKWSLARDDCYAKYPMGHKAAHADYDKQFKCLEDIQDAQIAFENKLRTEVCELHHVSCGRSTASEKQGKAGLE